jgi:hypothetical protein
VSFALLLGFVMISDRMREKLREERGTGIMLGIRTIRKDADLSYHLLT